MKILVVDDDASNRLLLRSILEDMGHEIREEETLERTTWIWRDDVDLAIVDGNFPENSHAKPTPCGRYLCEVLRHRGIKTVFVSGDSDLVGDELAAGFLALTKPWKMDELKAAIEVAEMGAK